MPAVPSRDLAAQLFCGLIQPSDHSHAESHRWEQILATLPNRIQPRYGLVQVCSNPAHQPGRGHQFDQCLSHGDGIFGSAPRAIASVASAANAPRANPDRSAALLTSWNSSFVSEN
jgi:hypothetical protein